MLAYFDGQTVCPGPHPSHDWAGVRSPGWQAALPQPTHSPPWFPHPALCQHGRPSPARLVFCTSCCTIAISPVQQPLPPPGGRVQSQTAQSRQKSLDRIGQRYSQNLVTTGRENRLEVWGPESEMGEAAEGQATHGGGHTGSSTHSTGSPSPEADQAGPSGPSPRVFPALPMHPSSPTLSLW